MAVFVLSGCDFLPLPVGRELVVENESQTPLVASTVGDGEGLRYFAVRPGTTVVVGVGGLETKLLPTSVTFYDAECRSLLELPLPEGFFEGGTVVMTAAGSIEANPRRISGGEDVSGSATCEDAAAQLH